MVNYELLEFAEWAGKKYEARVTSWGRDEDGNKQVGGHPNSWHLWKRGANAIDLVPSATDPKKFKQRLEWIADSAKGLGYQAIINYEKGYVHIEVPW